MRGAEGAPVANGHTFEIDMGVECAAVAQHRDVNAAITLP